MLLSLMYHLNFMNKLVTHNTFLDYWSNSIMKDLKIVWRFQFFVFLFSFFQKEKQLWETFSFGFTVSGHCVFSVFYSPWCLEITFKKAAVFSFGREKDIEVFLESSRSKFIGYTLGRWVWSEFLLKKGSGVTQPLVFGDPGLTQGLCYSPVTRTQWWGCPGQSTKASRLWSR